MAGIRGGQAYGALAKQSVKGTPVVTFTDSFFFSGGNMMPTRNFDQLSETDNSRDAGDDYVSQTGVAGTPELYVRDSIMHHVLESAMGTKVSTGATNYTHTLSLASALSYYTFAKMQGATLYEQYQDCMVNELVVQADAGAPLTASLDFLGRSSLRLAAEWAAPAPPARAVDAAYNFNDAAITLSGGAVATVSSFEMTLTNNVVTQQTDDSIPYDVVPGLRTCNLAFDLIFEDLLQYNSFHTNSTSGTVQSNLLYTTAANFTFTKGANNSVAFDFPKLAIEEFPVEPDPSGDPIVVPVRARSQRHASGLLGAVVKNQNAT